MSDWMKKVTPGEPQVIPARAYNTFIDAAEDYLRRRAHGPSGEAPDNAAHPTIVLVQNSTGAPVDRFNALGLGGGAAIIVPADDANSFAHGRAMLDGRVPVLPADAGRFAITLASVDDGEMVPAVIMGVVHAQVEVVDAGDKFAEATEDDTTKLTSTSDMTTTQILWKESGTGLKWAIVRLGNGVPDYVGIPQYQGMVLASPAQNQRGWMFAPVVEALT